MRGRPATTLLWLLTGTAGVPSYCSLRAGQPSLTKNKKCSVPPNLEHAQAPRDHSALVFDRGGKGAGTLLAARRASIPDKNKTQTLCDDMWLMRGHPEITLPRTWRAWRGWSTWYTWPTRSTCRTWRAWLVWASRVPGAPGTRGARGARCDPKRYAELRVLFTRWEGWWE